MVRNYREEGLQIIWEGHNFFELSKREDYNFLSFPEGKCQIFFQPQLDVLQLTISELLCQLFIEQ